MKLKELGEKEFIDKYIKPYLKKEFLLDVQKIDDLGIKIDGFPLKYLLPFMDYFDIGWKAVISTLSDLFSMGVEPSFGEISLGLNPNLDVNDAKLLLNGIFECGRYYNVEIIGGDTNSSSEGWVDVAIIGKTKCKKLFQPSPKVGDYVILTNPIGYTSLIFYLLDKYGKLNYIPLKFINRLKHPILNRAILNFIEDNCDTISYSTDISDGLLISLYNFYKLTNLGINIKNFGIADEVIEFSKLYSADLDALLKFSGEEYETILVIRNLSVLKDLESWGFTPIIIGEVSESWKLKVTGWDNFLGWF
jgi:thiamine-monophosphate kinase